MLTAVPNPGTPPGKYLAGNLSQMILPAGIGGIPGYSPPRRARSDSPPAQPRPCSRGWLVCPWMEAAGSSGFICLRVYWHTWAATSLVASAWAQRGHSNAAFRDSSGAELRHSPGEQLPARTSSCAGTCTSSCAGTCTSASICHGSLGHPQLLSWVQLQPNIPGQRSFGVAEPQDARDEGPQHPGPLATALWSLSNRILML